MKKAHCQTDDGIIQKFMRLTGRNWRSAMYIECRVCKYQRAACCAACRDFLCVPDENGGLVLLPVQDAEILFDRLIDKSECLLTVSNAIFCDLYRHYFRAADTQCPLVQAFECL